MLNGFQLRVAGCKKINHFLQKGVAKKWQTINKQTKGNNDL